MLSFKSLDRLTRPLSRYVFTVIECEMQGILCFIARQFVSELDALEFGVPYTNIKCYFPLMQHVIKHCIANV